MPMGERDVRFVYMPHFADVFIEILVTLFYKTVCQYLWPSIYP